MLNNVVQSLFFKCIYINVYTYICLYVNKQFDRSYCTMLHLFDDLWLDTIIPKDNDEGRAIYGNLENKINTLYWPVENSIPKNNDRQTVALCNLLLHNFTLMLSEIKKYCNR